jgi:predicted GNAT family acetyltransferase
VRAYVARDGGAAIAAAMVTVYDGLGEIGFVGTVPEARGRGLGLLVTKACAHDAFARGARRVFLQASAMGEPVYRRLGFVEVTRYVKFEVSKP